MKSKSTKKENKNRILSYWDKFAEHEHRPDIAGEHPQGDLIQGLFFIVFIGAVIIDHLFLKTSTIFSPYFPIWARIPIAILILWFVWRLAVGGLRIVFGEIRKKPIVVNQGIFSQTRHPIYLGAILMYMAALVLTLSLAAAAIWIFIILYYRFLARYEEKLLIGKFGDDYRQYMTQVPMWIPRPKT